MRRRVLLIIVFLILGAIVNVAVAWGCDLRYQWSATQYVMVTPAEMPAIWARLAKPDWVGEPWLAHRAQAVGVRYLNVEAGSWELVLLDGRTADTSQYSTIEVSSGWPFLCLRRVAHLDRSTSAPGWTTDQTWDVARTADGRSYWSVALKPLWPGFIINTLFYALFLWVLYFAPIAARRMIRRRRGQCEKCAYPIGVSPVCTECGAAVPRKVEA